VTLLSRKADYALLILSYLHQQAGGGTARAIAEKFKLGRPFVANILKELSRNGFVAGHRGVKGGYALARPAETITLAELLESIESGFRLTMCNPSQPSREHDTCAHAGGCTLRRPLTTVHQRLLEVLRAVTLADLFDPNGVLSQPSSGLLSLSLAPTTCRETSGAAHA
jgi:Rrf2 family protein